MQQEVGETRRAWNARENRRSRCVTAVALLCVLLLGTAVQPYQVVVVGVKTWTSAEETKEHTQIQQQQCSTILCKARKRFSMRTTQGSSALKEGQGSVRQCVGLRPS